MEQAKGFLRESLQVSIPEAFGLLRTYARTHHEHLTDVTRRLLTDPAARDVILLALRQTHVGRPRA